MTGSPSLKPLGRILAALLILSAPAAWSQQEVGSLQREYEARKITILPEQAAPQSLWWSATEGFKPIDEPALLKLIGYSSEAAVARKHKAFRTTVNVGMLGAMITGGLLMLDSTLTPMIVYPGSIRMNFPEMIVGGVVMVASMYTGLFWTVRIPPNTLPHGRIVQIARDYNDGLIDTINEELTKGQK